MFFMKGQWFLFMEGWTSCVLCSFNCRLWKIVCIKFSKWLLVTNKFSASLSLSVKLCSIIFPFNIKMASAKTWCKSISSFRIYVLNGKQQFKMQYHPHLRPRKVLPAMLPYMELCYAFSWQKVNYKISFKKSFFVCYS